MGGSSKSTTQQEAKPPSWAEGLFKQSASDASRLYNQGAGGNTYLGSTVADLSGTTMQGVNQLANAGQAWDTAGTRPLFQQIGAGAVSNPAINSLYGVANQAGQPTSAAQNLQGYASGDYLSGEGNPFYRQRLEGELADTAAQIRSSMSGMGRYGSDVSTDALAESLGQIRLQGLENDFNRQTQNQFDAVGMIDTANQGALGLQGNMLSSAGNLYGQGIGQGLQAADAMAGLDQQNFQNRLAGAGATLDAGNILDTQSQRQLQDEINKYYALDSQDWTRLGMLQSAASGAAGPYGSQLAQSRSSTSPGLGGILGGVGSVMGGK